MHTPPQGPSLDPNETVFTRTVRDYVFMCFAPSFLRSPGGAVTRISESKRSRSFICSSTIYTMQKFSAFTT